MSARTGREYLEPFPRGVVHISAAPSPAGTTLCGLNLEGGAYFRWKGGLDHRPPGSSICVRCESAQKPKAGRQWPLIRAAVTDGRHDGPVHLWFELTYSNYLVLPRSLMQAMPVEWQARMVACLDEMREAVRHLDLNDRYTVLLRGEKGRIVSDPYAEYRRPVVSLLAADPRGEERIRGTRR